jgi:hypothetical protein
MSTRKIVKALKAQAFRAVREELFQGIEFPWNMEAVAKLFPKSNVIHIGSWVDGSFYSLKEMPVLLVIEELAKRRIRDCYPDALRKEVTRCFYK